MAQSEKASLLPQGGQQVATIHPGQYLSFENQGLWLETEESAQGEGALSAVQEEDENDIHVNDDDAKNADDSNQELTGPEILFRLKFANVYGSVDWPKHLRRLDNETREDVHRTVLDTLREQPIDIRQRLNLSRYLRECLDGTSTSAFRTDQQQRKKKRKLHIPVSGGLWNEHITKISAYFGSHVASFFVFLRYLVYLDFFLLVIILAFVTLPQIFSGEDASPKRLEGDFGALSTSVMFYGAYSNTAWSRYDRPLAYFLTWLIVNVVCFIAIVGSMYVRYSRSKQAETTKDEFPYCWRLLSSWDHTVTTKDGASLHTKAIVTDTKEMIRDDSLRQRSYFRQALKLVVVRALLNLLVLAILALSGYLIYVLAESPDPDFLSDAISDILATYKLPLLVSGLKILVPPLLEQVTHLEKWHPRTEVKLNLARTAVFYLASLVIFLLSIYGVSTDCIRNSNTTSEESCVFCCWENEVGEKVFTVVWIDLGLIVLAGFLADVVRAMAIACGFFTRLGYREFTVSSEVLDLIYAQSLVWLGLFFSPLLAGAGFVKLVIIFYFRYVTARMCNVPPKQMFRASRSGNFFMFVLLINFFVCLFVMAYAIIELQPSNHCGPFMTQEHVYTVMTSRVGDLPSWLSDAVVYVSTPAIVVPFILLLMLGVLYYKAKSTSYKRVIGTLRQQLKFERRVEKRQVYARAKLQEKRLEKHLS